MLQMQRQQQKKILTPNKLQVIERVLSDAQQMEYAEVTLVIKRGELRLIKGPAPSVMLPK